MPLFRLAGETLESDISFPELPASDGPASFHLKLHTQVSDLPAPAEWIRQVEQEDGRIWMATGKSGEDYLLHFPRYADFLVSLAAGTIQSYPRPGQDEDTLRHLFLDHVMPLVLSHKGFSVLHASVVATRDGRVIGFLGKSGAGKSTLAAALCSEGAALMADDCLLLREAGDELMAVPLYAGLRLWDGSTDYLRWNTDSFPAVANYTDKRRVPASAAGLAFESRPARISALFLLNPEWEEVNEISVQPLAPGEALLRLLECSYCLDPSDRGRNEADFQRMTRLVQTVPVLVLKFPYDFAQMAAVRHAVLSASVSR